MLRKHSTTALYPCLCNFLLEACRSQCWRTQVPHPTDPHLVLPGSTGWEGRMCACDLSIVSVQILTLTLTYTKLLKNVGVYLHTAPFSAGFLKGAIKSRRFVAPDPPWCSFCWLHLGLYTHRVLS